MSTVVPIRPQPDPSDLEQALLPEEAAQLLRVTRKQVYKLAKRQKDPLPCFKVGKYIRLLESEVRAWQRRQHN